MDTRPFPFPMLCCVCLLIGVSCGSQSPPAGDITPDGSVAYLYYDDAQTESYRIVPDSQTAQLVLENAGTRFDLTRADDHGELKYVDAHDHVFTMSDNTFVWSRGDQMIAKGTMVAKELVIDGELKYRSEDDAEGYTVTRAGRQMIYVVDETGKSYQLEYVPAASGVKYANKGGYFFWTKGPDFQWGKDGQTIARGTLVTTHEPMTVQLSEKYLGPWGDESYPKRSEGYDWVSVLVEKDFAGKYKVTIRSRGDQKRPTCTFDGMAMPLDNHTLRVWDDDPGILLTFDRNKLTITPEVPGDADKLHFYCSGGATIQGEYFRLEDALDTRQVDQTRYMKTLRWRDQGFYVEQQDSMLSVRPYGFDQANEAFTQVIQGVATGAEIGDLNGDNFPELMIYINRGKPGYAGNVIGFSANGSKSVSMVNVPELTPVQSKGYMGFDEFAMVEQNLVRRFPIFSENDRRMSRSGKMRQIQYKLHEGEAMRQLVPDTVTEY